MPLASMRYWRSGVWAPGKVTSAASTATTLPTVPPLVEGPARGYAAAVRLLGATLASVVLIVVAAACASDDDAGAKATLPPIVTTTTVPTTIASTTTQPRFYKIQQGDTLGKIAAAFGLPIQAIMEKNEITDANKIFAGQILELPMAVRDRRRRRCRRSPRRSGRRRRRPSRPHRLPPRPSLRRLSAMGAERVFERANSRTRWLLADARPLERAHPPRHPAPPPRAARRDRLRGAP